MSEVAKFKKTVIAQMLITALIAAAVALALGYKPIAKGLVLGSLFSLLNFLIMFRHAPGRLGKDRRSATTFSAASLFFRLCLLGVPVYLAVTHEAFQLAATVIGIFNLQITILVYGLVIERFRSTNAAT
jgi:hypothetical protein